MSHGSAHGPESRVSIAVSFVSAASFVSAIASASRPASFVSSTFESVPPPVSFASAASAASVVVDPSFVSMP